MKGSGFSSGFIPAVAQGLERALGWVGTVEFMLAVLVVMLAFIRPRLASHAYERLESRFQALAANPLGAIVAVGLLALALRAALLPWLGAPEPSIHDEQSLLLQAQTFAAGRLANPVHPFWEHFETFHVNQLPAYASMYFPGRSAPLVAGLRMAGQPWLGIWLAMVLLCMASVWMLQAWVRPGMALLGGVLVVARLGVFSYWVNAYWGGAFTALGAMLVVGSLPRLLRQPRWHLGLLLGLGTAILMVSRPYEGALLCIPVAALLLVRLARPSLVAWKGGRGDFIRVALPVLLLAGAGGTLLLLHNQATTGKLFKTPYSLNRETYADAPAFLISPPVQSQQRGPPYFRTFYAEESASFERRGSPAEIARSILAKIHYTWNFYVGPTFTAAFVVGLYAARHRRFVLGTLVFFGAGYFLETWNFPHYTAPIFPVLLIITLMGFEQLRTFAPGGRPVGLALTRALPTAAIALLLLPAASVLFGRPALESNTYSQPCCALGQENVKSRLTAQLLASPGPDLVLVKDGPHNPIHHELVYNAADIDHSAVVWARSLGPEKDKRLEAYFANRCVWDFEWLAPGSPEVYRFTPRPALNPPLN